MSRVRPHCPGVRRGCPAAAGFEGSPDPHATMRACAVAGEARPGVRWNGGRPRRRAECRGTSKQGGLTPASSRAPSPRRGNDVQSTRPTGTARSTAGTAVPAAGTRGASCGISRVRPQSPGVRPGCPAAAGFEGSPDPQATVRACAVAGEARPGVRWNGGRPRRRAECRGTPKQGGLTPASSRAPSPRRSNDVQSTRPKRTARSTAGTAGASCGNRGARCGKSRVRPQ